MLYDLPNRKFEDMDPLIDPIIFMQIPRTGGLAFCQALATANKGKYWRGDSLDLVNVFEEDNHVKVMAGYFNLGYPSYEELQKPFIHLTLLRHPLDRVVTDYFSIRGDETHPRHEICCKYDLKTIAKEKMTREALHHDDLIGILSSMRLIGNRPCNLMQQSRFNIANFFTFFGLADRYAEFIDLCVNVFQWPEADYKSFNSVQDMPTRSILDSNTITALAEIYKHDIKFYDYAVKLYEQSIDYWMSYAATLSAVYVTDSGVTEKLTIETNVDPAKQEDSASILEEKPKKPGLFRRLWRYLFG